MKRYDYSEGDTVVFIKLLSVNNPGPMMVLGERRAFARENSDSKKSLMGINCMWFDGLGRTTDDTFNFKDIRPVDSDEGKAFLEQLRLIKDTELKKKFLGKADFENKNFDKPVSTKI